MEHVFTRDASWLKEPLRGSKFHLYWDTIQSRIEGGVVIGVLEKSKAK